MVKIVFWILNFATEICNFICVEKNNVFCTGYGCRTLEQNYECNLIKYNVKFIQNRSCCFLILPLFPDEILMPGFSTNYARCFLLFCLCKLLETGFLVPALFGSRLHLLSEGCAFFLGNVCERLCASRPLLGSCVHQESI